MRVRISEAIDYYNTMHPEAKITQRQLANKIMPNTEITSAQLYLIKLNSGNFGKMKTVNLEVLRNLIEVTGVTLEFLIDLET